MHSKFSDHDRPFIVAATIYIACLRLGRLSRWGVVAFSACGEVVSVASQDETVALSKDVCPVLAFKNETK